MSCEISKKRNNRKRKKSFLMNARKYGKKGYYGRGSELDSDTYQYFVRIMEVYREGFENEEDKILFVNNVFEQSENQEINCSCNQVGCRVIETLLPYASDLILKKFMEAFNSEIRRLCTDRFASHVLEGLVIQSCRRSLEIESRSQEVVQYFHQFTLKISRFLLNNLEDFIWDTYGNHIMRTCLKNLAQLESENVKKKETMAEESESKEVPEEYLEIVEEYAKRIISWPQFNELCSSELTSGFLQVLLQCLKKIKSKTFKIYLKKLLKDIFVSKDDGDQANPNILPAAFLSTSVIMILETTLQLANSKMFSEIYRLCFEGKLPKLATTRSTNFSVQKLLLHCSNKTEFEAIFDELVGHFGEIIEAGHSGVLLALAQSCKRMCTKQGSFVKSFMKSLHCLEPVERQNSFILCVCRLVTFDNNKATDNLHKEKLNLHGTLMVQLMLDFNKPIQIVNSLLSLDLNDLKNLFLNTMGSHIADSFVKGHFVGEKSKEKLVRKLMGSYQELAVSKYGSRSFEAVWSAANLKAKIKIMEELSHKEGAWANSDFGKIIAGKINLFLFKRNKEEWKNSVFKVKDGDEFLKDILK
nr:nucleolar protein 9 isoform X1 [Leptinotarsa decemlineata]XP_023015171.1 nucleolar protein 9 isoform X2 [Leptinotarsa decemlineata]